MQQMKSAGFEINTENCGFFEGKDEKKGEKKRRRRKKKGKRGEVNLAAVKLGCLQLLINAKRMAPEKDLCHSRVRTENNRESF